MSHPSLHFFFHYTLLKLLFYENSLSYMNTSDLNHQKIHFTNASNKLMINVTRVYRRVRQMTDIRVYHVDAFTTEKFGGNAAGVVSF